MQNVRSPRLVAGRCLLPALLTLSVFCAALEAPAQTPAPKYRRVDLGRGMWRVEPVLDASVVPHEPARPARTNAPDVEVARQMLAEARKWANAGQFARARQLIEWASTLDVDWETQQTTPETLMNELQIIELRLYPPQIPSGIDDIHADSLFRPGSRRSEFGIDIQGPNALRMPAGLAQPDAAGGTIETNSIEEAATTFAGASSAGASSADSPGQQVSSPPGGPSTKEEITASSAAAVASEGTTGQDISQPDAVGPAVGGNATTPPETWGFWRILAISALCGLAVMALFAFLMLRRVMRQQRDILRAMVETTMQRREPGAEAGDAVTVQNALVPADAPVQMRPGLTDQPIGWTAPDTFDDQKKRADDHRREQDRELMRQLISNNVSIRKQVADKRAAAA